MQLRLTVKPQTRGWRSAKLPTVLEPRAARPAAPGRCLLRPMGAARGGAPSGVGEDGSGREFASSLALMVLGAALISERLNGMGLVQQLELDHPMAEPMLIAVAVGLALAAVWPTPAKVHSATEAVRDLAGRLGFGGLSAAVSAELWMGRGLLDLLEIETGAEALSEMEAGLAFLVMLVLVGPRKHSTSA